MPKNTTTYTASCINVQQNINNGTVRFAVPGKEKDRATTAIVLQFDDPKAVAQFEVNKKYNIDITPA
jgi:hypothetical protein